MANEVGEGGGEVDDFAGGLDALDEAKEDDEPGAEVGEDEAPLQRPHLLEAPAQAQHEPPVPSNPILHHSTKGRGRKADADWSPTWGWSEN